MRHGVEGDVGLLSDLAEAFADRVEAVLLAPCTPTGNTNESLTGLVVADVLVLALTALDETSAIEHSHQLNALRGQLLNGGGGAGARGGRSG
ncbi:hypothetical protein [Streptomyces sp. NPDC020951]|uniref:hypothetical protein n=1 Tax=Streptomyces sp. NPDC020951 TaxID=3365104 RepID=UPI00379B4219